MNSTQEVTLLDIALHTLIAFLACERATSGNAVDRNTSCLAIWLRA